MQKESETVLRLLSVEISEIQRAPNLGTLVFWITIS